MVWGCFFLFCPLFPGSRVWLPPSCTLWSGSCRDWEGFLWASFSPDWACPSSLSCSWCFRPFSLFSFVPLHCAQLLHTPTKNSLYLLFGAAMNSPHELIFLTHKMRNISRSVGCLRNCGRGPYQTQAQKCYSERSLKDGATEWASLGQNSRNHDLISAGGFKGGKKGKK